MTRLSYFDEREMSYVCEQVEAWTEKNLEEDKSTMTVEELIKQLRAMPKKEIVKINTGLASKKITDVKQRKWIVEIHCDGEHD